MFVFPVGFLQEQRQHQIELYDYLLNDVKFLSYFQLYNGNIVDLKRHTVSKHGSPNILSDYLKADSNTLQLTGNSSLIVDLALPSVFTIECFIWLFETSSPQFLFGTYNVNNAQSQSLIFSTEKCGNDQNFLTNVNLPVQTWFHAAVTFDSSNTITLYIDGISQGAVTLLGLNPGTKFYIGGTPDDNNLGSWFVGNGYFDEFRITNFVRYVNDFDSLPYNVKYSTNKALLTCVSGGDTNGLFYFLGYTNSNNTWSNAYNQEFITTFSGGTGASLITARDDTSTYNGNCYTDNAIGATITVDLKNKKLAPSKYTIQMSDNYLLRSWDFDASNDNLTWTTLDSPRNTNYQPYEWVVRDIPATTPYKYFRIVQQGDDSLGTQYICIAELELYGTLNYE